MYKWLLIFSFSSLGLALLLHELPLEVHKVRKVEIPVDATYDCQSTNFQYAQVQFNTAMNITPPELTWRNVTQWATQIGAFVNSTQNFLTLCKLRTKFFQQLGSTYSSCINRFNLLKQLAPGSDPRPAFEYPDIWYQMDFMCNAGLQIAINDWYTLTSLKAHDAIDNCTNTFFNQTFSSQDQLCTNLPIYLNCIQNQYLLVTNGDVVGAWYWCEEARVVFDYDCPTLRCYVGGQARFFEAEGTELEEENFIDNSLFVDNFFNRIHNYPQIS